MSRLGILFRLILCKTVIVDQKLSDGSVNVDPADADGVHEIDDGSGAAGKFEQSGRRGVVAPDEREIKEILDRHGHAGDP